MTKQYYILILSLTLFACQTSPVSTEREIHPENEKTITSEPVCEENTTSGNCALLLSAIDYDLPDEKCQVYDLLIEIDTKFKAPAGLDEGSTARVDWEFFPKGNAGFWTMPIEDTILNEGTIRIHGCFTYGEQDTLKITRTITDHEGVESNSLSIDIPRPKEKSFPNTGISGFEILLEAAEIH